MKYFNVALSLVLLATVGGTAEAGITITSSSVYAQADTSASEFNGTTIPTHLTLDQVDGGAYNKTSINWYESGGQTILSHDFDQRRTGSYQSNDDTHIYPMFTANSSESYKLSGFYNVTETDEGEAGSVYFRVQLVDKTLNRNLYYTNSAFGSLGSAYNPHFAVRGNVTGTLIAGHSYAFYADAELFGANPKGDFGSSAIGNITVTIGPLVPEPAVFLLAFSGLPFLATRRRRPTSHNRV